MARFPDLHDAINREEDLRGFFETTDASGTTTVTSKELACYDYIHRHMLVGFRRFKARKQKSSSHSGLFGSLMMNSPFLFDDHESLEMVELLT